jgi:hypothetical protein
VLSFMMAEEEVHDWQTLVLCRPSGKFLKSFFFSIVVVGYQVGFGNIVRSAMISSWFKFDYLRKIGLVYSKKSVEGYCSSMRHRDNAESAPT